MLPLLHSPGYRVEFHFFSSLLCSASAVRLQISNLLNSFMKSLYDILCGQRKRNYETVYLLNICEKSLQSPVNTDTLPELSIFLAIMHTCPYGRVNPFPLPGAKKDNAEINDIIIYFSLAPASSLFMYLYVFIYSVLSLITPGSSPFHLSPRVPDADQLY